MPDTLTCTAQACPFDGVTIAMGDVPDAETTCGGCGIVLYTPDVEAVPA